jgi:outer membrane protein OmpA-like peptidoglycan-associated protein
MADLMNQFRGDTLNDVASALGEHPGRTQAALGGVIPALIGGLAFKASNANQASSILDVMTKHKLDSAGGFADASGALKAPGGINSLINLGGPLMSSIFGGRSAAVTDWVASHSGVSRSSSSSLLSLALPIVLGVIARHVRSAGWNPSSLMNLLGEQRAFLKDAPAGLADVLGAPDTSSTRREVASSAPAYEGEPVRRAPVTSYEAAPTKRRPWLWAVPLLFLIPLLAYFLARNDEPRHEANVRTTPAPRAAIPPVTQDRERPVGTASEPSLAQGPYWIHFDTGSRTLTVASAEQLRKVVEFLRTHPRARAEVIGYADGTGNQADNMKLSQERAAAVMDEVARRGIARSRMTAQGFGVTDPVADNATADGRQRNRRVEIRITED